MNFDQAFVQRIIQQDELAFATFYEQSVDDFFRYIISHYALSEQECNDIVSSVYLKIWDSVDKYDANYSFGQFVRGILKNHCKDYFKKSKPLLFSQVSEEVEASRIVGYGDEEEDDLFQFSVESDVIKQALCSLDRESQELIHARFVLGYDYDLLSEMFAVQSDNLRQKISRILKKLRSTLAHTQK